MVWSFKLPYLPIATESFKPFLSQRIAKKPCDFLKIGPRFTRNDHWLILSGKIVIESWAWNLTKVYRFHCSCSCSERVFSKQVHLVNVQLAGYLLIKRSIRMDMSSCYDDEYVSAWTNRLSLPFAQVLVAGGPWMGMHGLIQFCLVVLKQSSLSLFVWCTYCVSTLQCENICWKGF